jgi:alpha-tubulin suppressor-like RCC1 family protein
MSMGSITAAAIKTDGTLWTWGNNDTGQLGVGNKNGSASPLQVGALTDWSSVSVDTMGVNQGVHVAAIKTNGTLWLWGGSSYGKLGIGAGYVNKSSPVQIGALTNWSGVSVGAVHTAAVKTDGTLWLWGQASYGKLGFNTTSGYLPSPTQLGTDTNWRTVVCGPNNTMAIKTDGTLWVWGFNPYGELGIGSTTWKSSPTQVGAGTNWNIVSHTGYHTLATKTDGTLWSWGVGSYGALGQNDGTSRNSPTQVGSGTTWSQITSNSHHSMATKTDGTLWAWGMNTHAELGLNNTSPGYVYSPVQVGTSTWWTKVAAGVYGSMAIAS